MPLIARRGMPCRRRGDERLHLADHRSLAVQRHRDRGAGNGRRALVEEQSGRVGDALDPVVVQQETADFVGRAEAVLHAAHHAQRRRAVTLEVQHDVDEVLQRPRTGDGAVLGDVADEQHGDAGGLGRHRECGGDGADLGDAAGDAVDLGGRHGLHRVHDDQRGLHLLDVAERGLQVGLGRQVHLVVGASGALGTQPDLACRLLTREVERTAPVSAQRWATSSSSVDFPTPGSPASSVTEPGTRPPPSTRSSSLMPVWKWRVAPGSIELMGTAGEDGATARLPAAALRGEHRDLVDRAPGAAVRAAADPLGGDVTALRAAVLRTRLRTSPGHESTVVAATDRTRSAR